MGLRSWWNKVTRATPEVPDGIARYEHELDGVSVITAITTTIATHGGSEVCATVPAAWGDVARPLLRSLVELATAGQPAVIGGFTGFRDPGFAKGNTVGVTYARPQRLDGVPGSESALVAVLLHERELELVQRGHATRILTLLGERARTFPFPRCWEIRDKPVLSSSDGDSTVDRLPIVRAGEVWITTVEDGGATDIIVSMPRDAIAEIRPVVEAMPRVLALGASLSPDANAHAVWHPRNTERAAITRGAPPFRIGQSWLAIVGVDKPTGLTYVEDGVSVVVDGATFDAALALVLAGEGGSVELGHGTRLVVRVRDATVRTGSSPSVTDLRVVLVTPEAELAKRIEVSALADLVARLEDAIKRAIASHPVGERTELALLVSLARDAPRTIRLAYRGTSPALLQPLHDAIAAMPQLPTRGDVELRLEATLVPPN